MFNDRNEPDPWQSFRPERLRRIHPGGPTGWDQGSHEGHAAQKNRHQDHGWEVSCANAEKKTLNHPGQCVRCRQTEESTQSYHTHGSLHHASDDGSPEPPYETGLIYVRWTPGGGTLVGLGLWNSIAVVGLVMRILPPWAWWIEGHRRMKDGKGPTVGESS